VGGISRYFPSIVLFILCHSSVTAQIYKLPHLYKVSVKSMSDGLERILTPNRAHFKSEGERRIAYFLDDNSIRYQYEPGILVNTSYDKLRIWYPDFHLPEFASYIEYFGLVGKKSYDEGIKTKLSTYNQMGLDVIPLYPWTFSEDWQKYIMDKLEKKTLQRYNTLKSKKYWSHQKPVSYPKRESRSVYGHGLGKRY